MRSILTIVVLFAVSFAMSAENLLKNAGFEEGAANWLELNSTCQIVPGAGRDGSAALRISRQSVEQPRAVVKQDIQLVPGRRYRFGGWIRCEGELKSYDKDGAKPLIAIECWRGGNYGGYAATWSQPMQPQEWTWFETEYTAGDPAGYQVILYASSATTCGTWYYDDIVVEQIPGEWSIGQVFPMHNRVKPEGGDAVFHTSYGDIEPEYQRVEASLLRDGVEAAHWDSMLTGPHSLILTFPALPKGDYELAAALYDNRSGEELARKTLPVTVTNQTALVTVNEDWTVSAEGKRFLPVGAYCGNVNRDVVDEMKSAGFNCVLTYDTIWCSLDGKSGNSLDALTTVLDYCAEQDFKMVLSLGMFDPSRDNISSWDGVDGNEACIAHLTGSLRNHPALLAWYIADEPLLSFLPWCGKVYEIIKENDPEHPVLIVFNEMGTLPKFTGCSDLFGFDEYPITQASSLGGAVAAGERMHAYNVPFWWVGQIMSWGIYKDPKIRYPTEEEMLAQNLLAFINNAKGVINYTMHSDQVTKPGDEALRNLRLGEFRRVNMACQELADFILNDDASKTPQCNVDVTEGTLKCRVFSNGNGEFRLLLVSPFAGPTKATITLPEGLTFAASRRYAVTPNVDGTLTFIGHDVTCDIVTLAPPGR